MLVDKNGKEITAGCKILVGETVFDIWAVDPEVRQEVKDFLATTTLVEDDRESTLQLAFSNRTPMEPSPIKEWLNIPPAPEGVEG